MSKEIRADYTQQYLFPPSVEDWVPADHPARFIREFVDALDMDALGIERNEGDEGRPHYAPDLLMKVWVYGYFSHIYSCRKLEKACMDSLSLVWLTGNNAPDHNTLWRFFKNNKKAIRKLFKQGVKIAADAGLVGMALHALDGTKIKSLASNRSGLHREDLEKALEALDATIDELEKQIERERGAEDDAQWRLPAQLCDTKKLREAVSQALSRMAGESRDHLHPVDEQARMMKCEGTISFAYNAQAMADAGSGLIVAQEVYNEENDAALLVPMLEEAAATLSGGTAEETLADGGYVSGAQIEEAREKEFEILLPVEPKNAGPYHTINFQYDEQRDVVVCPMGEALTFEREKEARHGGYMVRVYRCRCRGACPAASQCSRDKRGRMIEISPHYAAMRAQLAKQRIEENRCKLKRRSGIIERVFAGAKEHMRFRRFTFHGLESVRAQWSLLCVAYNLKKMLLWWRDGKLKLAFNAV